MKKYLAILFVMVLGLSSCIDATTDDITPTSTSTGTSTGSGSTSTGAQAAADDAAIQAYLKANNLTALADPSGVYYNIVNAGSNVHPVATSTITVSYTGKLLNGTQFDSSGKFRAVLNTLIQGWIIGLPQIGEGGSIILYIPSGLAYGTSANGSVPANSVLIFNITLSVVAN